MRPRFPIFELGQQQGEKRATNVNDDDDAPPLRPNTPPYGQPTPPLMASTAADHCIDLRLGPPRPPAVLVAAYALIDTLFPSVDDVGLRWMYPRLASGNPTQVPSNGNNPSPLPRMGIGEAVSVAIATGGDVSIALVPHFVKNSHQFTSDPGRYLGSAPSTSGQWPQITQHNNQP